VHGTESIYANKNYRGHGSNISVKAMDNSPEKDIDLTIYAIPFALSGTYSPCRFTTTGIA
jgi:hypothetical protein